MFRRGRSYLPSKYYPGPALLSFRGQTRHIQAGMAIDTKGIGYFLTPSGKGTIGDCTGEMRLKLIIMVHRLWPCGDEWGGHSRAWILPKQRQRRKAWDKWDK